MDKKSYLPSKLFVVRVVFVAIILLIVFGLYKIVPIIIKSFSKSRQTAEQKKILVKDLVEKDSNSNGLADWEESLYGLDPTKDGEANREIILAKRKVLGQSADGNPTENLTVNDQIARELLALIVTLRNTGNLNTGSIDSISKAIGQKITMQPIPDIYTKDMLTITNTNLTTIRTYYNDFKKINTKYQNRDMGNELTFISQGIQNNDQQAFAVAQTVAEAYRGFAKDLMTIKIPDSLIEIHLGIVNSYEKTAQSIEKMELSSADQITGLNAILSYKQYSNDSIANLEKLQIFFQRNGIL